MDPIPVDRAKFEEKFEENRSKSLTSNRSVWNRKQLDHVKNVLARGDSIERKSTAIYHYVKKYELLSIKNENHVIVKRKSDSDDFVFMVATEDYFPKLWEAHSQTGHGSREKMLAYMKKKWRIPRFACDIFVTCCEKCNRRCRSNTEKSRTNTVKKGVAVVEPIISIVTATFNSRGQLGLIDFQSTPDGEYSWLMNYQDHATKFLQLRPLKSKHAASVADELSKIFFTFGAPNILECDNDKQFVSELIEQLVFIWPSHCQKIEVKPRRPQQQASVKRTYVDVKNLIEAWMIDNKSSHWSRGCYQVQWTKNTTLHGISINQTPYEALFGPAVCSLSNSFLTDDHGNDVNEDVDYEARDDDEAVDPLAGTYDDQCDFDIKTEMIY